MWADGIGDEQRPTNLTRGERRRHQGHEARRVWAADHPRLLHAGHRGDHERPADEKRGDHDAVDGGPHHWRRNTKRHDQVAHGPQSAVADEPGSGRRYDGRERRRDAEDRPRPAKNKRVLHELSSHGWNEGGGDDVAKAEGSVAEYQAHRVEVPVVALAGLWLAL